jgi:hypothetical protein
MTSCGPIRRCFQILDYGRLDACITNQRQRVARRAASRVVIDDYFRHDSTASGLPERSYALGKITNGYVNVKAFHDVLLLRDMIGTGAQLRPAQQFSVRKPNSTFICS